MISLTSLSESLLFDLTKMMFIYFDAFCPSQNKSVMSGQYRIDGVQTHFISALNQCIRREDSSIY